ncbi:primosomal protein N' [Schleiferiaceae bacterium]|nr:primosomal protein N' [Schleiferiaceae bacterium]
MWVEVILPVPVHGTFTYAWDAESLPAPGMRVHVPFGRQRCLMGVVRSVLLEAPTHEVKGILRALDTHPRIQRQQLSLWDWMSDYYACSLGEVMQAALPHFFKLEEDAEGPFTISDGAMAHWRWIGRQSDQGQISAAFEQLSRATKQSEALLQYFQVALRLPQEEGDFYPWVAQNSLLEEDGMDASSLRALQKKGFLEKTLRMESEAHWPNTEADLAALSSAQNRALAEIREGMEEGKPVLLRGMTGSGKTELYVHLAAQAMDLGQHTLLLVPEIALTAQLYRRLDRSLGRGRLLVYHSQVSDGQRRDVWEAMLRPDSAPRLILAARSGLFLPMERVGCIIVDEEHETSYKQQDPAPRYHGRDVAVWLAHQIGAALVLGSATPSLESYQNARQGKYLEVVLSQRFGIAQAPAIEMLSLVKYQALQQMEGPFTRPALEAIAEAVGEKKQALVFQNRRGYSPFLTCMACGWTEPCTDCDVAVTYHKTSKSLHCHYCGQSREPSPHCPSCGKSAWQWRGLGTERVEEHVEELFPEARILRIDSDSTRKRAAMSQFVDWLEHGEVDIVVGTQMIGKGLDLSGLDVAVVLNADNALQLPDFRAHERAFQLFTQVAGRTGRRDLPGKVLIQTATPEHPVLLAVQQGDYVPMAESLLADRKTHHYPPYVRMIRVEVRHRREYVAQQAAHFLAGQLNAALGGGVLGPDAPSVARIKNVYLQHLWLKLPADRSLSVIKKRLRQTADQLSFHPDFKSVKLVLDVDPA